HGVIVTAFIIIIVGGIGSLEGAVVAAVLYAFVHTFVTTFFDGTVADITGLLLMLIVLVIKPTGLFGTKERA
ncbi:MAG: branched-chain amino acid ABC transporter permease, partial [Rhodovibrionaceae bacterium]